MLKIYKHARDWRKYLFSCVRLPRECILVRMCKQLQKHKTKITEDQRDNTV